MTPAAIIRKVAEDGISLALSPTGKIKAIGSRAAVTRWFPTIRQHKPEIIAVLKKSASDPLPVAGSGKPSLNTGDESAIRAWLAYIGEVDPALIEICLKRCRADPEALAYFIGRSREVPEDDRRFCNQCVNLTTGKTCRATRVSPILDLPQRCENYSPGPDDPDRRPGIDRWPALSNHG